MEENEIIAQLEPVFASTFNMPELQLSAETSRNDIPDWDSLANIRLLMAVEKEFSLKFSSREISGIQEFSELLAAIASHLNAKNE